MRNEPLLSNLTQCAQRFGFQGQVCGPGTPYSLHFQTSERNSTLTYQNLLFGRVPMISILRIIIRTCKKVGFGSLRQPLLTLNRTLNHNRNPNPRSGIPDPRMSSQRSKSPRDMPNNIGSGVHGLGPRRQNPFLQ